MDQQSGSFERRGVIRFILDRRVRKVLGWLGIIVGLIGIGSAVMERRVASKRADLIRRQSASFRELDRGERTDRSAPIEATWEGRTFRKGDAVRITSWAGTFKPQETGSQEEVDADYGHTGILLAGERSATATEPVKIVRIRWAPQKWKINGRDRSVDLPQFEATIHVSYLEVVP